MTGNLQDAIRTLKEAEPDRDHILISASITRGLHYRVTDAIQASRLGKPAKPSATVFLTTNGGDPDGAFRIARCLRHHYADGFRLVVPSWCKSAGTLIAIAADELAIGDLGELGPLDIQVNKGSELYEQSSGLDLQEALGKVSAYAWETFSNFLQDTRLLGLNTSISTKIATQISGAMSAPILAQIDPMRLGEMQRAMRIAHEYGTRLNSYSQNLKEDGLNRLIHGYPSHSFVIDRKEAKEIFQRVTPLTAPEQLFVEAAWNVIGMPNRFATFVEAEPTNEPSNESHDGANDEEVSAHDGEAEDGRAEDAPLVHESNDYANSDPTGLRFRSKPYKRKDYVRVL